MNAVNESSDIRNDYGIPVTPGASSHMTPIFRTTSQHDTEARELRKRLRNLGMKFVEFADWKTVSLDLCEVA